MLFHLQIKYKEKYEKNKGKVIGIKSVSDDSAMAHSAMATKLQSDRNYKKDYEDTKTKYKWGFHRNGSFLMFVSNARLNVFSMLLFMLELPQQKGGSASA